MQQLQQIFVLVDDGDRRALRNVGLTPTQYTLLRCLYESPEQELTVSRLAAVMLCTRGNATRLVQRLEDAGLIGTRDDDHDQRLVLVGLTGEGEHRLGEAKTLLAKTNKRRLGGMSHADLQSMTKLATTLADVLAKDLDGLNRPG